MSSNPVFGVLQPYTVTTQLILYVRSIWRSSSLQSVYVQISCIKCEPKL